MSFPVEALVVHGGEIYCHIHENELTGLKRDLFWAVRLEFEPIQRAEETFDPSLMVEWLSWPIRSWSQLGGQDLGSRLRNTEPEASFYLSEHDSAAIRRLRISREGDCRFRVNVELVVDFYGFDDEDRNPELIVRAEGVLPFTELVIVPGNLSPPPGNVSQASRVASDFVDLADFEAPVWQEFRYHLRPKFRPSDRA